MTTTKMTCDVPVERLEYFSGKLDLKPKTKYTLVIDYPLNKPANFEFESGTKPDLAELFAFIGKCYKNVYRDTVGYGVWGHDIEDLVIEGVSVDNKAKTIKLGIGS